MRILLVLVGLALTSVSTRADCLSDGLLAFPAPGSVVPTNARFILEGVGGEQARVEKLVGQELLLVGGGEQIPVKVVRGWKSTMNRVAVVLRPLRPLRPNASYALPIERQLPGYTLLRETAERGLSWLTGDGPDTHAPVYRLKPSIAEGMYRTEGTHTVRYLKIHTTLVEDSPAFLIVTTKRARGGAAAQTYFVPLNGGEGLMGNDGCSGSFSFDDGRAYRASIEGFDASGNAAPRLPQIEFQAPTRVRQ